MAALFSFFSFWPSFAAVRTAQASSTVELQRPFSVSLMHSDQMSLTRILFLGRIYFSFDLVKRVSEIDAYVELEVACCAYEILWNEYVHGSNTVKLRTASWALRSLGTRTHTRSELPLRRTRLRRILAYAEQRGNDCLDFHRPSAKEKKKKTA